MNDSTRLYLLMSEKELEDHLLVLSKSYVGIHENKTLQMSLTSTEILKEKELLQKELKDTLTKIEVITKILYEG
jgi:hypothetical protein